MPATRSNSDQHLSVLIEVVRQMSETFELAPLLCTAERAALTVLQCDRATIFLYDRGTDELYSKVATGTDEIRFPAKLGIAGEVVRTRSVVIVQDAYQDPRFNPEIDRQTGYRTRNMLTLPLIVPDGEVIGALQLLNKLPGPFDDRDELLAGALGSLIGITIKRQILLDAAAEKERLEHDLNIARHIQTQMLPKAQPEVAGFDIAGWNQPADQTGGDCYSFLPLPGGQLGFLIADASGHGIGPALVVTQCRAMIRALAGHGVDMADIAGRVNNLLSEDLPGGRFVTACFGVLDPASHTAHYVSAGHGPLLWFHAATGEVDQFGSSGLPLAVMEDSDYAMAKPITFEPGDLFCLLTDGFTEWTRPDGDQYGDDRMTEIIKQHRGLSSAELIRVIHEDVLRFSEGTSQADDLTVVIIKRVET